jgi:hypothetical protein
LGAIIFQCPVTGQRFRSHFSATPEELRSVPQHAVMELQCEICKQRHKFKLAQCTLDNTD